MDEFLGKLAEDQRRFQQFLRTKASRLTKMGEALARCRSAGARILVVGEPPLDRIASFVAAEYLDSLGARELVPGTGSEPAPSRRDVVLVLSHEGSHPGISEAMSLAGARGARVLLVGSIFARDRLRARTDVSLGLPMKGAKTIGEASLVLARILARIARGISAESASDAGAALREEPAVIAELVEDEAEAEPLVPEVVEEAPQDFPGNGSPGTASPGTDSPGIEPLVTGPAESEPLVPHIPPTRALGPRLPAPPPPISEEPVIELEPFSDVVPALAQKAAPAPPLPALRAPAPLPQLKAPAPSSLLASVRPMLRFALGAYPEDASGPAHRVETLSSDGVVFFLDADDETGATLDVGDELWVRLELDVVGEHLHLRGRVRSVELAGSSTVGVPQSRVELIWADGSDLRRI